MIQVRYLVAALALVSLGTGPALAQGPAANMSFFVTSSNPGNGGNLGGLSGADAYCESLAAAVGAGGKGWRAYLSTDTVNARDRIGSGPWYNVRGVMIAQNVADLHGGNENLTAENALNEKGASPNYLSNGQQPLQHDVLTGTNRDGTSSGMNCNNWTDGSANSTATLGHADRMGRGADNPWNSVHPSQGCSMDTLQPTGGAGLFYCFATN